MTGSRPAGDRKASGSGATAAGSRAKGSRRSAAREAGAAAGGSGIVAAAADGRQAGPTRRVGAETSETRALILGSTEQLMVEEGYAAVTYRHVAARAGVTPALVQYYFPTLDSLFIALMRRHSDRDLGMLSRLLEEHTEGPLRAIWEYSRDEATSAIMMEFLALGNHRKAIRAEIAAFGQRTREVELAALAKVADRYRLGGKALSPATLLFLLSGIPKMMLIESDLGLDTGHAGTLSLVEELLDQLDPLPPERSADR